ncbi:unnamed protein product [Pleuronectes platessa]|uniref:Uncharacterized protein n=1 Tax=Pleuronectes platessa TaxID=8262 RepID=A0A9N7TS29_PLEPL|nr:unnamed protein product [Pleuronectes platessa]
MSNMEEDGLPHCSSLMMARGVAGLDDGRQKEGGRRDGAREAEEDVEVNEEQCLIIVVITNPPSHHFCGVTPPHPHPTPPAQGSSTGASTCRDPLGSPLEQEQPRWQESPHLSAGIIKPAGDRGMKGGVDGETDACGEAASALDRCPDPPKPPRLGVLLSYLRRLACLA